MSTGDVETDPAYVNIPNLVALGQRVWAYVGRVPTNFGDAGPRSFTMRARLTP